MARKAGKSCASKDTFWNRKRVEKGVHIRELAEVLGCGVSTLGSFFSGQHVPNEKMIEALCTLLDVDPLEGTREFIKANKEWDTQRGQAYKVVVKQKVEEDTKPKDTEVLNTLVPITPVVASESVLEILYGKVSYDDYNAIESGILSEIEVLRLAYDSSKVDFDTFMKLIKKGEN